MDIQTARRWRLTFFAGLLIYVLTISPTVRKKLVKYSNLSGREAQVASLFICLGAGLAFRLSPAGKTLINHRK